MLPLLEPEVDEEVEDDDDAEREEEVEAAGDKRVVDARLRIQIQVAEVRPLREYGKVPEEHSRAAHGN